MVADKGLCEAESHITCENRVEDKLDAVRRRRRVVERRKSWGETQRICLRLMRVVRVLIHTHTARLAHIRARTHAQCVSACLSISIRSLKKSA